MTLASAALESALQHHRAGRLQEAADGYREALRLQPDLPAAHNNLGLALRDLGYLQEAESCCREALRLGPELPEPNNNLAITLRDLGRLAEAETYFRTAIRLRPSYAGAHANFGISLLLEGRLIEGWPEYEWRWLANKGLTPRAFKQPLWKGENIGNRTLLLHAEQGFGDTLQFCRYAPLISAASAVILEAPGPLVRLLSGFPGVTLIAQGDALPSFDLHCPLLSLPLAFGTTLETIPADVRYLRADLRDATKWRDRLRGLDGLKVGIAWSGSPRPFHPAANAVDRRRSIPFAQFASILGAPGVAFISLQKHDNPSAQTSDARLLDWTDELHDFADTAALIDALDLVISVDTAVIHLAGSLGKPTWLLNRFDTCWRWLLNRDDSPWYPTVRQFRQPSPGDWNSVLATVRAFLSG
jgi:TPR repeat/Tetratricopeptide repeat/Glycosyltransferase family 9 (heptosyltransferase)